MANNTTEREEKRRGMNAMNELSNKSGCGQENTTTRTQPFSYNVDRMKKSEEVEEVEEGKKWRIIFTNVLVHA